VAQTFLTNHENILPSQLNTLKGPKDLSCLCSALRRNSLPNRTRRSPWSLGFMLQNPDETQGRQWEYRVDAPDQRRQQVERPDLP